LREELPWDAGVQDEQDPGQDLAVVQAFAAGMVYAAGYDW
jgi:hypothetical protein